LAKVLPPGNLFSFSILGSLFGHLVVNLGFQVSAFLLMLPFDWYESSDSTTDKPEASDDNTSIFVIACFQVLIAGLVFNIGPPYRRETLENFWFTASISFIMLMTIYLLMVPETVGDWFEVVELEPDYRWILAMLACGNLAFCYFHEKLFLPKLEDE
jgi:cation-transporting ATPase 13A3/4/5